MQTPGALSDGEKLPCAFGLNVGVFGGMKFVAHGGRFAGYRAELVPYLGNEAELAPPGANRFTTRGRRPHRRLHRVLAALPRVRFDKLKS